MITDLCETLHNWFCSDQQKHFGSFTVSGGSIAPADFLVDGQFFRIVGSVLNDGVYQWPCNELLDEQFDGAVWAMCVPPAVIQLAQDVKDYCESDAGKPSAMVSESFGGYSYTKGSNAKTGAPLSWQSVFADRMRKWRKI